MTSLTILAEEPRGPLSSGRYLLLVMPLTILAATLVRNLSPNLAVVNGPDQKRP